MVFSPDDTYFFVVFTVLYLAAALILLVSYLRPSHFRDVKHEEKQPTDINFINPKQSFN
jgi:hypothetical protein